MKTPHLNDTSHAKMIGEMTDEVVAWEVNQQCNLMNAIFSQVVNHHVQKLRKEKCCGCEVDHPSQRRHDCIMMTEEEGWITLSKLITLSKAITLSKSITLI